MSLPGGGVLPLEMSKLSFALFLIEKCGQNDQLFDQNGPGRHFCTNFKRAGGSKVDFHFLVVSDREECQLLGTFYGMKNIFPSQSPFLKVFGPPAIFKN